MIKVLDNNTINKIAAGEVVERPSSVVKELVENSIDAGATAISVEIKDGGTTSLKISDNGCGIEKAELKTAFVRHATSKLQSVNDLNFIRSMGFRGEALPSIASVAQFVMTSRRKEDDMGARIEIYGGNIIGVEDCAANPGTHIKIDNLFYNVPARKKFLKKPSSETTHVTDLMNKIALGNTNISFRYVVNGEPSLNTSGKSDLKAVIFNVYGREIFQRLIEINKEYDDFRIHGYIVKPEIARANRTGQNMFINGRVIKNETIQQAVEDCYRTRIAQGRFPVFVLNVDMPPSTVDVNVHPAKLEVRFHDENMIYGYVCDAINSALDGSVLVHSVSLNQPTQAERNVAIEKEQIAAKTISEGSALVVEDATTEVSQEDNPTVIKKQSSTVISAIDNRKSFNSTKYEIPSSTQSNKVLPQHNIHKVEEVEKQTTTPISGTKESNKDYYPPQKHSQVCFIVNDSSNSSDTTITTDTDIDSNSESFLSNYTIVGQLFKTYWIIESGASMYLVDQHAAHERVLYEEVLDKLTSVSSQLLIQPINVRLDHFAMEFYRDNIQFFEGIGFKVDIISDFEVALHSVPMLFDAPSSSLLFTDIIETATSKKGFNVSELSFEKIASIACKAAIKGNRAISEDELKSLIDKLLTMGNIFSCPHGRPTIIEISKNEVEKKFMRT